MRTSHPWTTSLCVLAVVAIGTIGCGPTSEPPAEKPAAEPAAPSGPAGPMGTATISGSIRYEGELPPIRPIKMDADPGCLAKHSGTVKPEVLVLGDNNALANVLVHVKSGLGDASYSPPSAPVVLDQNGCQYIPHVMGVMVGQTFRILNSDGLLHNVHSFPKANKGFNQAMPAAVTQTEFKFGTPEAPFEVKCDVHPWMKAYVSVLAHPFFAVTGTDGRFTIAKLPAGTYEIEAWHERLGARTAQLTVTDGATGTHDFTFTR